MKCLFAMRTRDVKSGGDDRSKTSVVVYLQIRKIKCSSTILINIILFIYLCRVCRQFYYYHYYYYSTVYCILATVIISLQMHHISTISYKTRISQNSAPTTVVAHAENVSVA